MNNYRTIILLLAILTNSFVKSQTKQEVIDLADKNNIEQNVKAGTTLNLKIKSLLPNENYSISVEKKLDLLQTLKITAEININPAAQSVCPISRLLKFIDTLKSEKELVVVVNKLEKLLSKEPRLIFEANEDLTNCSEEEISKAKIVLKKTTKILIPQKLEQGELLEVTIKRKKAGTEKDSVTWKRIFRTAKKGRWLTTYGFTFISQSFKREESFFTRQVDSTFAITPLNQRSKLSFVPSVFFTWLPYTDINRDISWSLTGGLGYDLEAPTVFLGANILYNQNLGVSIGIAAHQQDFLNGRYNEGDIVLENLADNQLNEKLYALNPYLSVNFRFGTSPLKKQDTETE